MSSSSLLKEMGTVHSTPFLPTIAGILSAIPEMPYWPFIKEEIGKMEQVPWQYFVAIPDLVSTGIKDDKRHMGWAAIIRAVNTVDAVTAEAVEIPWTTLTTIRDRIIAEVPGINRVLWDISDKPTSTIEWE